MPLKRRGIGERTLERVVLARRGAPRTRSSVAEDLEPAAIELGERLRAPRRRCSEARRFGAGLGEQQRPAGEIERRERRLARGPWPLARRQRSRPAIIRWITRNSSPSSSRTMRFPEPLDPGTFLPKAAESGGWNVRNKNGLRVRTARQLLAHRAAREVLDIKRDVGELGHRGSRSLRRKSVPGGTGETDWPGGGGALWHDARPMCPKTSSCSCLGSSVSVTSAGFITLPIASRPRYAGRSTAIGPLDPGNTAEHAPHQSSRHAARVLARHLDELDAAFGGVERLHLVGSSTGGVRLPSCSRKNRPSGAAPSNPRGLRSKRFARWSPSLRPTTERGSRRRSRAMCKRSAGSHCGSPGDWRDGRRRAPLGAERTESPPGARGSFQ